MTRHHIDAGITGLQWAVELIGGDLNLLEQTDVEGFIEGVRRNVCKCADQVASPQLESEAPLLESAPRDATSAAACKKTNRTQS